MQGFVRFHKGLWRLSWPLKLWLLGLFSANAVVPVIFLNHVEAQFVLGALLVGVCLMSLLTSHFGFTRILGLGHLPWLPLLVWLAFRLESIPAEDVFGLWIRGVMLINSVSLLLDGADVVRYATGDRKELVHGL